MTLIYHDFIAAYNLSVEKLTKDQLAEVLRQAIECGDFIRHVRVTDNAQSITYIPYAELEKYKRLYHELLFAVESIHEGETRHEIALRYIREREQQKYNGDTKASS